MDLSSTGSLVKRMMLQVAEAPGRLGAGPLSDLALPSHHDYFHTRHGA